MPIKQCMFFRFAFARVTSVNTCLMKDITFLELVDLDRSPDNRIVSIYYPDRKEYLPCPHHIVTKIASVSRANINEALEINNMKTQRDEEYKTPILKNPSKGMEDVELKYLIHALKESTSLLKEMQDKIGNLEKQMELFRSDSKR